MSMKTILLVDDEPHIVHVLALVLRQAGFRVFAASDGEEAFELATRHPIDLVITDMHMPGGGGIVLAQRLWDSASSQRTPVILLTAETEAEACDRTPNIRSVVSKPFSPRALVTEVRRHLEPARDERVAEAA